MQSDRSTVTFGLKVLSIWLLIDAVLMLALMAPLATEGAPRPVAEILYPLIHYVIGFPLVYVDPAFPYFLQAAGLPAILIPMMLLNYALKVLPFLLVRTLLNSASGKTQAA